MVHMQQSNIQDQGVESPQLQGGQSLLAPGLSVQGAEARVQDLQTQLEALQDACQKFQQSLHAAQTDKRALDRALQESLFRERTLQERVSTAEQSAQEAIETVHILQERIHEANIQIDDLQQRVQVVEHRAQRRAKETRQTARETESDPPWVVQRDEIVFEDEELGRGGWAVVKIAKFRATHVAAKCLYGQIVSNYNRVLFIHEMNMAARVRHPNLLQFIGATLRGELIILTELMPTSIRRELENECTFSPKQITSISLDVARSPQLPPPDAPHSHHPP